MIRRDAVYWARLRKDRRSALAVGGALIACLAALLCAMGLLIGTASSHGRGNPLYWVLILPFAWWASGLAGYEPRAIRTMRPALAVAVVAAAVSLAAALALDRDPTPWAIGAGVTVLGTIASLFFYRDSLLAREGPAR